WEFGDSTTSSEPEPRITLTAEGNHLGAVRARNSAGFSDPYYFTYRVGPLTSPTFLLTPVNGLPLTGTASTKVHEGRLMVAQVSGGQIHFSVSGTTPPYDQSDWLSYPIAPCAAAGEPDLAIVGGRPAIAFNGPDSHLSYTRATTAVPLGLSDWQTHALSEVTAQHLPSLIELNGTPAIACRHVDFGQLVFARSSSAAPSSTLDWTSHAVDSTFAPQLAALSAAVVADRVWIAYCEYQDAEGQMFVRYADALVPIPTGAASWHIGQLLSIGANVGQVSIVDQGGQAVIGYGVTGGYNIDRISMPGYVLTGLGPISVGGNAPHGGPESLAVVDGRLLAAIKNPNGTGLYLHRQAALDPNGSEDWQSARATTQIGSGDTPSVAVHNGRISVTYRHVGDNTLRLTRALGFW
ncbi:MAG TPA: hypothetical protein VEI97_06365, partial [bacterium]|nr:hypothetical protein [bacterium]